MQWLGELLLLMGMWHTSYTVTTPVRCVHDNSSTQRWSKLLQCPYLRSSFADISGFVTATGGDGRSGPDNKLLNIVNDENKKWVEHFPPMPTKRFDTAVVTTTQHLIVAGGKSGKCMPNTVELMDVQTLVWSTAASLPHPYSRVSASICGDHLYMLGGKDEDGHLNAVLTCSLTKLIQSCSETPSDLVWHRLSDIPVSRSTCVAVNGELLVVGGRNTV